MTRLALPLTGLVLLLGALGWGLLHRGTPHHAPEPGATRHTFAVVAVSAVEGTPEAFWADTLGLVPPSIGR